MIITPRPVIASVSILTLASPSASASDGTDGVAPFGRERAECLILNDANAQGIYVTKLWPDGVVPFEFVLNPNAPGYVSPENRARTLAAMATIEGACGARFVPRNGEPDYVVVRAGAENTSWVGKKGGAQFLTMFAWESHYTIVHELMHCLGCWHEQQRPDRDQYVTIRPENIQEGGGGNFAVAAGVTFGWYDFDSVMHYGRFDWSANGHATIDVNPGYERWMYLPPNRERLSAGDRWVLTEMYGGERPPGVFEFVSPLDKAVGEAWAPAFSWTAAELAESYRLIVDDDPSFASPVIDVAVFGTSFAGGPTLAARTTYFWTVAAVNAAGETPAWSTPLAHFYTADAVPPVLFVDADAPGGDGWSWDTAATDLQQALDAAASAAGSPVEVRVAAGVYTPDRGGGDRGASFALRSNVSIRGGYAGHGALHPDERDPDLYLTVLSGDLAGDDGPDFENNEENSTHVIWLRGQGPAVLDGCTISGGNADGDRLPTTGLGGGLWVYDSTLHLKDCVVIASSSRLGGGGIALLDGGGMVLEDCSILQNRHTQAGPGAAGGGLLAWRGWGTVSAQGSLIAGNTGYIGAGALFQMVVADVERTDFTGNVADLVGGGIGTWAAGLQARDCRVLDNTVTGAGGAALGGGMAFAGMSNVLFANGLVAGNMAATGAAGAGGGLYADSGSSVLLVNTTITENAADAGGAVFATNAAGGPTAVRLHNSIAYGNDGAEIVNMFGATTDAAYCDVKGGYPGPGNIDADPDFAAAHRPRGGSPVNDAGLNELVPLGILTDLAGAPRFADDPGVLPVGAIVDMGAFEFQGCYADFDGSGSLDLFDLLAFVNAFNTQDPTADCDGDDAHDLFDFLCFVNAFNAGC